MGRGSPTGVAVQHVQESEARTRRPGRFMRGGAVALLALLAACGGGSGTADPDASGGGSASGPAAAGPTNAPLAAARFLTQASYGPTGAEITRLQTMSYAAWIDEQFAKPQAYHRL